MDKLIFSTAGNVDDGKSTLIGRLLFDSGSLTTTKIEMLNDPKNFTADGKIDLSLLTDGLKSEREQGITVDVAYKYFQTNNRRFIIADTPGHKQYTRNTVTGASNVHLGIILIDARKGITEQTKRHSSIYAKLGVKHVIVCINKIDMVDYNENVFTSIQNEYNEIVKKIGVNLTAIIPVSALEGDNVVNKSDKTPWYDGQTLLHYLENLSTDRNSEYPRFAIQTVIRPNSAENPDYRGYAGRVNSGTIEVGQEIVVLPYNEKAKIKKIEQYNKVLEKASTDLSVIVHLDKDIDASRGDLICAHPPEQLDTFHAEVCWLGDNKAQINKKYVIRHLTRFVPAMIVSINNKFDLETLETNVSDNIEKNDIGNITLRVQTKLPVENFTDNKATGQIIIIDPTDNQTVAVGMINTQNDGENECYLI